MYKLLLLLFSLFATGETFATRDSLATFVFPKNYNGYYNISSQQDELIDSSCTLSFNDVYRNPVIAAGFKRYVVTETRITGNPCKWLRMRFVNETGKDIYFNLVFRKIADTITGYKVSDDGTIRTYVSGTSIPPEKKPYHSYRNLLPLHLQAGESCVYYINTRIGYSVTVETAEWDRNANIYNGFFLGFVTLMLLIAILLFFLFRDREYVMLGLPLFACLLYFLEADNILYNVLPWSPYLVKYTSLHFLSAFYPVSWFLCFAFYMNLRRRHKTAFRIYMVAIALVPVILFYEALREAVTTNILNLFCFVVIAYSVTLSSVLAAKKERNALILTLFIAPHGLASMFYLVQYSFNIFPSVPSVLVVQSSALLASLIMGYALYNKVNLTIQARIAAIQDNERMIKQQNVLLEEKVEKRTHQLHERTVQLETEKKKSDDLLLNILPAEVAEELKERGNAGARQFDEVSVMFTDFVNFTGFGERIGAKELVDELDTCFRAFDSIMDKYGIEKIKTIGDAYLAVSGLPVAESNHACKMINAALEIQQFIAERRQRFGEGALEIRIGIHSGPVVAGIVGVKKFAYDVWGDTVNTAARMEESSQPGKINISHSTYELVKNDFRCSFRGEITPKHKGAMKMYFVESRHVYA